MFGTVGPKAPDCENPITPGGFAAKIFSGTQANTWSNLAYVLVGFDAIGLGCHDLNHKPPIAGG